MYAKLLASTLVCLSLDTVSAQNAQLQSDVMEQLQADGIKLDHTQYFALEEPSGTGFTWQY